MTTFLMKFAVGEQYIAIRYRFCVELCNINAIIINGLLLATINLSTKFEVPISTHYEATKGDTKY